MIVRRIGLSAVCLHEVPSKHPLRVTIPPDTALPLHAGRPRQGAPGLRPGRHPRRGPGIGERRRSRRLDPERFRADLADIVTTGVARIAGEGMSGSVAIAVPIFREDGIVAAIGVVGPESRCGLAWRTRVARLLPGAAQLDRAARSGTGPIVPGLPLSRNGPISVI